MLVVNWEERHMRQIWYLTGLEYKKLWKKKLTWISTGGLFLLMLASAILSMCGQKYYEGIPIGSSREWDLKERAALKEKEGVIDEAFLAEAEQSVKDFWAELNAREGNEPDAAWYKENYEKRELPYNTLLGSISLFGRRSDTDFSQYYELYEDYLRGYYEDDLFGEDMEDFVAMSKRNQPFNYGWMRGYDIFIGNQSVWGAFTCLVIVICLAGMFAGETSAKMDALMLSARYGKNKILAAKLLTGISFSILFAAAANLISFLLTGLVYGFEGADIAAQMCFPFIAWNVTMGETAVIMTGSVILAAVLTAALTMLLSARMKSSSPVLIVMFVFLFAPFFFGVSSELRVLKFLFDLLPTKLMYSYGSFNEWIFRMGNTFVTEWQYAYPVYLFLTGILSWAAYQSYRRHQVGR